MSDDIVRWPSWRYHATEPPKIIQSAAEEADGWFDSPTKANEPSTVRAKIPAWAVTAAEEMTERLTRPAPEPFVPDFVKRLRGRPRKVKPDA